jgi:hypothetical protein
MNQPVSFLTLEEGTPVLDRFGRPVGEVDRVLLFEGGGFDGLIVRTDAGGRFVDAPEVRRISRGAVTLGTTVDEVERPASGDEGRYGVPMARYGRTEVTEADRDAVIECLKAAFVREELSADALGERVARVHLAETLDELDAALIDLTGA